MGRSPVVTGFVGLVGSKNIASYRWRDSRDVDFFFFLKESFRDLPVESNVRMYNTYMYIRG